MISRRKIQPLVLFIGPHSPDMNIFDFVPVLSLYKLYKVDRDLGHKKLRDKEIRTCINLSQGTQTYKSKKMKTSLCIPHTQVTYNTKLINKGSKRASPYGSKMERPVNIMGCWFSDMSPARLTCRGQCH